MKNIPVIQAPPPDAPAPTHSTAALVADPGKTAELKPAIVKAISTVFDPEIPVNVVELGLVYDLSLEQTESGERKVYVKLTLTAPGCGMGDILVDDARTKLEMIPTVVEADVDLVFDPPWTHSMMSDAAKLETGML